MRDKNLLSIKDFSKFAGIKQTTLRYYDDIGLFSPVLHTKSGYRYYSPVQILALNAVRVLSDLNMPRKEILALAKERTPERALNLCFEKKRELNEIHRHISHLEDVLNVVQDLLYNGMYSDTGEISVGYFKTLPGTLGPVYDFAEGDSFFDAFQDYCARANESNRDIHFPMSGYFETVDAFFNDPKRPKRLFLLDPHGKDEKPAGMYLYTHLRGDYDEVGDVPERMRDYAQENELDLCGPVYRIFLHDEISVRNPEEYLSRFSIGITPTKELSLHKTETNRNFYGPGL